MEEQFIFRVPPSVAARLEKLLNEDPAAAGDANLDLSFQEDGRTGVFCIGEDRFPAALLDLPTVVESWKTYDDNALVKTADVGQMILVREEGDSAPEGVEFPDGLTPPMRDARRRRFRREADINPDIVQSVETDLLNVMQGGTAKDVHIQLSVPQWFRHRFQSVRVRVPLTKTSNLKPSRCKTKRACNDLSAGSGLLSPADETQSSVVQSVVVVYGWYDRNWQRVERYSDLDSNHPTVFILSMKHIRGMVVDANWDGSHYPIIMYHCDDTSAQAEVLEVEEEEAEEEGEEDEVGVEEVGLGGEKGTQESDAPVKREGTTKKSEGVVENGVKDGRGVGGKVSGKGRGRLKGQGAKRGPKPKAMNFHRSDDDYD